MNDPEYIAKIVTLEVEVAYLKKTVDTISADVRAVRDAVTKAGGGWKVIAAISGFAGVLGAFLASIAEFLPFLKG